MNRSLEDSSYKFYSVVPPLLAHHFDLPLLLMILPEFNPIKHLHSM